jgi:hypothetical protein
VTNEENTPPVGPGGHERGNGKQKSGRINTSHVGAISHPPRRVISAESGESNFHLFTIDEIDAWPDPEWLVAEMLPTDALVELYGKEGLGKSFFALDMALCVASGRDWKGREVRRGEVVYVNAEGGGGIKTRIRAWVEANTNENLEGFRVLPRQVDFQDSEINILIDEINVAQISPKLIVIDTLARCFGGGDENSAGDMGRFVHGCDRLRTAFSGATVLVIHHAGKDPRRGARGSSALGAAVDTKLAFAGQRGSPTIECLKQRDAELFKMIFLDLQVVDVQGGQTSCVLVRGKASSLSGAISGKDRKLLTVLADDSPDGLTAKDWEDQSGLPETTFHRHRDVLVAEGFAESDKPGKTKGAVYRVTDKGRETLTSK